MTGGRESMLNRIRRALGLPRRITQAEAREALHLLRQLRDVDGSRRRAYLMDETQALLYRTGTGTIGCEHLGLNNDGTPIRRPAPHIVGSILPWCPMPAAPAPAPTPYRGHIPPRPIPAPPAPPAATGAPD